MAASARTRLRNKLLRIGGVDVDFIEDPYFQVIADAGAPFANTAARMRGRPNECHRNAALFWLKGKCAAIAVGYYLGPDDVWGQHSWGVMGDGTILDTDSDGQITVVRDQGKWEPEAASSPVTGSSWKNLEHSIASKRFIFSAELLSPVRRGD